MSFSDSARMSAKRLVLFLKKHVVTGLLGLFGINPAFAAGECLPSPISTQTQYGQVGGTLVFSCTLTDNRDCGTEFDSIRIISDTTESAGLVNSIGTTVLNKPAKPINVELDGNIGSQVEIAISFKNNSRNRQKVTWEIADVGGVHSVTGLRVEFQG